MIKARPRQYFRHSLLLSQFKEFGFGRNISILDAGAGNYSFITRLNESGYKNTKGIDIEPQNKNVIKADVCNLPFKDKSLDVVFCGDVLEHIKDDRGAMKEFNRVLKQNGVLFVSVAYNPKLMKLIDLKVGHKRRYTKESFFRLANSAGFSVKRWNYWGFPLMRIYNWMQNIYCHLDTKNKQNKVEKARESELFNKSKAPSFMLFLNYVFYFDNLFNKLPLGIGLNAVLVKK